MLVTFVALVSLARALELGNMKRDSWIVDCQMPLPRYESKRQGIKLKRTKKKESALAAVRPIPVRWSGLQTTKAPRCFLFFQRCASSCQPGGLQWKKQVQQRLFRALSKGSCWLT